MVLERGGNHVVLGGVIAEEPESHLGRGVRLREGPVDPDLTALPEVPLVGRPQEDIDLPSVGLPAREHRIVKLMGGFLHPIPEFDAALIDRRIGRRIQRGPEFLDEIPASLDCSQLPVSSVLLHRKDVADGALAPSRGGLVGEGLGGGRL